MTRKDYNALADAIRRQIGCYTDTPLALAATAATAHVIADVCAADNPRFDRDRFLIACGVPR